MKISLSQRKLKDGRISLSIEFYRGSEITEDGKRKHLRSFENLDSYLINDPKTAKEKKENKEVLEFAENVVAIRKAEYAQGRFELKNTTKAKRVFLNFFAELTEEKQIYLPIQNLEKIFPKTSSLVISPEISPRYSRALRSS